MPNSCSILSQSGAQSQPSRIALSDIFFVKTDAQIDSPQGASGNGGGQRTAAVVWRCGCSAACGVAWRCGCGGILISNVIRSGAASSVRKQAFRPTENNVYAEASVCAKPISTCKCKKVPPRQMPKRDFDWFLEIIRFSGYTSRPYSVRRRRIHSSRVLPASYTRSPARSPARVCLLP